MAVTRIPSRMAEALRTAWLVDKALGNILVPLWSPWPALVPGGDLAGVRSDQGMRIYAISLASGMRPGKGMRNSCSFSEPAIAFAIASHVIRSKKGKGEWAVMIEKGGFQSFLFFPMDVSDIWFAAVLHPIFVSQWKVA